MQARALHFAYWALSSEETEGGLWSRVADHLAQCALLPYPCRPQTGLYLPPIRSRHGAVHLGLERMFCTVYPHMRRRYPIFHQPHMGTWQRVRGQDHKTRLGNPITPRGIVGHRISTPGRHRQVSTKVGKPARPHAGTLEARGFNASTTRLTSWIHFSVFA